MHAYTCALKQYDYVMTLNNHCKNPNNREKIQIYGVQNANKL